LKLHKICLENIRSYISEEIVFPDGKVLLWGNIGSGKSSILYGIDFVLFGLQRAELAGASLLRNGTEEGSVELFFSLGDQEYAIKRVLKRTKNTVVQDAGHIIRNGVKEEKTALELKQIVLELLHYPRDLITKNKTLIYRYTVYTPQEEMKTILLGPKEERLDTLRKVFGVDKYKRIKENTKILISEFKERKKIYEGASMDLPEKVFEKEKKELEKKEFGQKFSAILPLLEDAEKNVRKKKDDIILLEGKKEEFSQLEKELALCNLRLNHLFSEKEQIREKETLLTKEIELLEQEKLELHEGTKELVKELDMHINEKEKELREILNKIQELKTRKMHSLHIQQKIESLHTCPTCFQEVSLVYKQKIIDTSLLEVSNFDTDIKTFEEKQGLSEAEIKKFRLEIEGLKKKEQEFVLVQLKLQHLTKKKEEFSSLQKRTIELSTYLLESGIQKAELEKKQGSFAALDTLYPSLQQELQLAEEKLQKIHLEKTHIDVSQKHISLLLNHLEQEIQKKILLREKKEDLNKTQFWLSDYFVPLMEAMEKNVLFKVHGEFNALFEKWFTILIDNQTLSMCLDDEYSPKIQQNGYDIEYEFLSGGEKTAGALAYRLALNQVINNLHVGIKTEDLLILDEPTDGFSHEQLDRLKILMDELRIPQIILVSHEPQIECFADHIIRFEKRDHITKVIS